MKTAGCVAIVVGLLLTTPMTRGAGGLAADTPAAGRGLVASAVDATDRALAGLDELMTTAGADRAAAVIGPMVQGQLMMLYRGDLDGDGVVTYAEQMESSMRMYEQQMGPEKAAAWRKQQQEQMRQYLERYDTDHDGQVSQAEQFAANQRRMEEYYADVEKRQGREAAQRMREQNERHRAPYLEQYDLDDDGQVTADEVRRVTEQMAAQQKAQWEWRRALRRYDADGDGELNTDERAKMKADGEAIAAALRQRLDATKKRYDTDGDGVLSESERAAMAARIEAAVSEVADAEALARDAASHGDGSLGAVARVIRAARYRGWADAAVMGIGAPDGREAADDDSPKRPLVDDR